MKKELLEKTLNENLSNNTPKMTIKEKSTCAREGFDT